MAAEFIAEEGDLKGLILALEEGEEWTIGRDPEKCTLAIEDPKASRKHLMCRKTDEGFVVENLSESNPVKINDREISEPTLLQDGDKVLIGGTVFHFYEEGAPPPFEAPPPEKMEYPPEEELPQETIYKEEAPEVHFDLTETSRFILKVIAGPNTGAEFALDFEKSYLIGTDAAACDIVFHDLSVSREHARLEVTREGEIAIEDLDSRNGVVVDKEKAEGRTTLSANTVVSLGTSAFLIIDREAPAETIAAQILEPRKEEVEEVKEEVLAPAAPAAAAKAITKPALSTGTLILALIVGGIVILVGIGMVSLFKGTEVTLVRPDYVQEIQTALKDFPDVRYTFNPSSGKLFLVGHVTNGIEKSELLYNLRALSFITGIEDNIVVDESVWQEMNILLSKNPQFQGISMHSPKPGVFVLTGYLKTTKQAGLLTDYMNLHFNYLDRLQNLVIVEEQVLEEVSSRLLQQRFNGVSAAFANGELILTGYISSALARPFNTLVQGFEEIPGVRFVRNYVVALSPEQAVVDLNREYPGRYRVTGYSTHGDVNINVVINGRLYTRGDTIEGGFTITSIQPDTIFLEKDGLKYKIEYNK